MSLLQSLSRSLSRSLNNDTDFHCFRVPSFQELPKTPDMGDLNAAASSSTAPSSGKTSASSSPLSGSPMGDHQAAQGFPPQPLKVQGAAVSAPVPIPQPPTSPFSLLAGRTFSPSSSGNKPLKLHGMDSNEFLDFARLVGGSRDS